MTGRDVEPLYGRRYLWRGRTVHAVRPNDRVAACGFRRDDFDHWLGHRKPGRIRTRRRVASLPSVSQMVGG